MNESDITRPGLGEDYLLLHAGRIAEVLNVFRENMGTTGISTADLPHITCPSGGAISFSIRTLDGEESAKEVEGIVLAWQPGRAYWQKPIGEGGGRKPPDCISRDGLTGVGNPGGSCGDCPYAQFGSAPNGRGQACKAHRRLLIVRPGEILPHLLTVPPTSLRPVGQYFTLLLGRQIPFWTVTTRIRLERATSEDGVSYAKMQFILGRCLTAEEKQVILPYHAQMRQLLNAVAIDARDYAA